MNGYCEFSFSIADNLGNPFDSSSPFTLTQAVLTENTVLAGSFMVTTDGKVTISTTDKLNQGIYNVIITMNDLSVVGSTLTSSITWNFTLTTKCLENLINQG